MWLMARKILGLFNGQVRTITALRSLLAWASWKLIAAHQRFFGRDVPEDHRSSELGPVTIRFGFFFLPLCCTILEWT